MIIGKNSIYHLWQGFAPIVLAMVHIYDCATIGASYFWA